MFNALEYCISSNLHHALAGSRSFARPGTVSGAHDNAGAVSDADHDNTGTYASADDFTGADHDNDGACDDDNDDHYGCEYSPNFHRLQYSGILIQRELQHGENGCLYRRSICDRRGNLLHWTP